MGSGVERKSARQNGNTTSVVLSPLIEDNLIETCADGLQGGRAKGTRKMTGRTFFENARQASKSVDEGVVG